MTFEKKEREVSKTDHWEQSLQKRQEIRPVIHQQETFDNFTLYQMISECVLLLT